MSNADADLSATTTSAASSSSGPDDDTQIAKTLDAVRARIDAGETDAAMELCNSLLSGPDLPVHAAVKVGLLIREMGDTERAEALFAQNYARLPANRDAAMDLCNSLLADPDLPVHLAVKVGLLLRELGETERADALFAQSYTLITTNLDRLRDPERAIMPAAEALAAMGHFEDADALCRKALDLAPDSLAVAVNSAALQITQGRHDAALAIAEDFCTRTDSHFNGAIHFALIFTHLKSDAAARACFDRAKAHCKTKTQRAKLDVLLAAQGMTRTELDQHGMAVELFDGFARNYDAQLTKLGNNGPDLIQSALQDLNLPKTQTRRVLDAGCGTGLCAGFLRPYAKELTGIDVSVGMLEISRSKGCYDFLARTDLSEIITYPEGTFDMIVCADVLVYFGALDTVLRNLSRTLNPGGWLLLSVEQETDLTVKAGFKLYPTGRHKHQTDYLTRTLSAAGFAKPKLLRHERLRNELGAPIPGTIVAVQKLALSFF